MAIVEISIVPLGTGTTSMGRYVAFCIKVLEASGLSFQVHGIGTIIERALQDILRVITQMHEVPFEKGAARVVTSIKIDDRRDKDATFQDKVLSVTGKNL